MVPTMFWVIRAADRLLGDIQQDTEAGDHCPQKPAPPQIAFQQHGAGAAHVGAGFDEKVGG